MSKARMINTRFWDDNYTSNLDPIEKLLFLYFLTNTSTNICGIYEIPLKKIAVETGVDKDMVLKVMDRFTRDVKIFYVNGWIGIKNFVKNQNQRSITVQKGIENEIMAIPKDILNKMIEYGYPIDTLSYLIKSNLIKSNLNTVATATTWNFEEELKKLKEGKRKDYKIIALYWKKKGWVFENKDQFDSALTRELKPAKALKGYEGNQIAVAIKFCEDNYPQWTLESVGKRITDLVNKK